MRNVNKIGRIDLPPQTIERTTVFQLFYIFKAANSQIYRLKVKLEEAPPSKWWSSPTIK